MAGERGRVNGRSGRSGHRGAEDKKVMKWGRYKPRKPEGEATRVKQNSMREWWNRRGSGAGRKVDMTGMSTAEGGPEAQSSAPGRAADPAEKRSRKGGRHDGNVYGRGRARGSSTKGEYCKEVNTAKSRKYGLDANRLGMKPGSEVTGYSFRHVGRVPHSLNSVSVWSATLIASLLALPPPI
ncbi:hypothetical protein B0H12DRAFT_1217348 [Mycena haematopus]|nr:hypothetical protein B0H12DRAFT_1217348 [Mycena haematopus]